MFKIILFFLISMYILSRSSRAYDSVYASDGDERSIIGT